MLKMIVAVLLVGFIAYSALSSYQSDNRQAQRTAEQAQILVGMEALHNPSVSRLADEWRIAYPSPNAQRLTELRVMAERVRADPASADMYTAEYKQKKFDALGEVFRSPFSGTPIATPGLN